MLYKHQRDIVDEDPKKCGIFHGTGSGKSKTALSLSRGKTLIICPKTQFLDGNWVRESLEQKKFDDLNVISKEMFKKVAPTLRRFDTVIIDEAHTVLGASPNLRWRDKKTIPKCSQIFEAVKDYLERTHPERIYLCTATPARNPMSIWAAAVLLGRKWDWEKYRRTFYVRLPMPGREVWMSKKDKESKEHLARLVKSLGYVGRLSDWFDVPSQVDKYIHCPLTAEQKTIIKDLPLLYPDPLVLIGKTAQVEQGIVPDEGKCVESTKLDAIEDLLEEYSKVVIFCRYIAQIEMINDFIKRKKIDTYILTGATKDRKSLIAEAEENDRCAFICQSSIGSGFELPSFRCMIFASMDYSVVNYTQSRGRILRANNLQKNLFVHLYSGEIDEEVIKCQKGHKDFEEKLYLQNKSIVL